MIDTKQVPPATLATYCLGQKSDIVRINKCLYGLPQAGRVAEEKLITLLARNGYNMTDNTECLFRQEFREISFALVVDNFAIKYKHREDVEHLLAAIEKEFSLEATGLDRYSLECPSTTARAARHYLSLCRVK